MMDQPIGSHGSPNHHQVVLSNWARLRGIYIGAVSHHGRALFIDTRLGAKAFVIERRGPGGPIVQAAVPYRCQKERREAFKVAMSLFDQTPA